MFDHPDRVRSVADRTLEALRDLALVLAGAAIVVAAFLYLS